MDINALGARMFRAFEQGDRAALDAILADDARLWNPFVERSKRELFDVLPESGVIMPGLHYDGVRRRVFADGSGFAQQHIARGIGPDGPLALPAGVLVDVRDGQVTNVEMYYDTAPVRTVGLA